LSMARILVVEDEPAIAELLAVNLRHAGHEVALAGDAAAAQAEVDAVLPDLVVLDWMLPGQSGLSLARRWRDAARTRSMPIIMLSARAGEPDRIAGLDGGVDDYLTKPFSPNELVARIRAMLRRAARIRWMRICSDCAPCSSTSTACAGASLRSLRRISSASVMYGEAIAFDRARTLLRDQCGRLAREWSIEAAGAERERAGKQQPARQIAPWSCHGRCLIPGQAHRARRWPARRC